MYTCVISVFGRGVNEIYILLVCYTALITAWHPRWAKTSRMWDLCLSQAVNIQF